MSATPRSPVQGLLGRYAEVFRAAWARRHELAGPHRLAEEAAFLPAALSLQETPPHPAPRRILWLIVLLVVVGVAWSFLGQVDIVAVAQGPGVSWARSTSSRWRKAASWSASAPR